ncbi:NAD(P)H-binding protein [Streptomyces sp. NPDC013012]|uniref:NAD(P)H-binding protein n=1 Tax=Streptomyces sp. NPDC013012 TaxID=3364860 RepID=UPI0036C39304
MVRDPARLAVTGTRLVVRRAEDPSGPEALRAAVAGRDAVLSGPGAGSRADAGAAAGPTRSVLAAAEAGKGRRLLVVGAAPPGPAPAGRGVLDRAVLAVVGTVPKDVRDDLRAVESDPAASGADRTAVRPPRPTDGPVAGGTPPRGRFPSRAGVAHATPAMADDPATIKQGVGVAYQRYLPY